MCFRSKNFNLIHFLVSRSLALLLIEGLGAERAQNYAGPHLGVYENQVFIVQVD